MPTTLLLLFPQTYTYYPIFFKFLPPLQPFFLLIKMYNYFSHLPKLITYILLTNLNLFHLFILPNYTYYTSSSSIPLVITSIPYTY